MTRGLSNRPAFGNVPTVARYTPTLSTRVTVKLRRCGAGDRTMRPLALTAAALHVVVSAVAAFLMFFVATFPFENRSVDEPTADDWLIGAAAAVALLALVIGGAVVARSGAVAAVGVTAQLTVGAVVFAYALGESEHGDGVLMLYGLAFAVTAVVAATATHASQHRLSPG